MNFSEDQGVSIIYVPTKFKLHRFISNGDLLSDRNLVRYTHTHRYTDTHIDTHTDRNTHIHRD